MSTTKPHPIVYLLLCLPFGATSGYTTVTLTYQLVHAGVGVATVAAMISASLITSTWKALWAPLIDITLNSKQWYLISATATAVTISAVGFLSPSPSTLWTINILIFINSIFGSILGMAVENLLAHMVDDAEKGRAGGWYQAGNLGGAGLGGGGALWIAQNTSWTWLPAVAIGAICLACCFTLFFIKEPPTPHIRHKRYWESFYEVATDVCHTIKSRDGLLALLICFLPIGSGAAAGLWAAVASEWNAKDGTVILVNGALNGLVSAIGCIFGGYLCDRMDRKISYALFGSLLTVVALGMAVAARSEAMFVVFTLLYAFVQGLNYASFTAVVLEAIGRGSVATKYNLYASLSNMPIIYMTVIEGHIYERWQAHGLLLADAISGLLAIIIFSVAAILIQRQTVKVPA